MSPYDERLPLWELVNAPSIISRSFLLCTSIWHKSWVCNSKIQIIRTVANENTHQIYNWPAVNYKTQPWTSDSTWRGYSAFIANAQITVVDKFLSKRPYEHLLYMYVITKFLCIINGDSGKNQQQHHQFATFTKNAYLRKLSVANVTSVDCRVVSSYVQVESSHTLYVGSSRMIDVWEI